MDGSVSYDQLNDSSDICSDTADHGSADSTFVLVSKATVSPNTVPAKKKCVQVQEVADLLKCREAEKTPSVNVNYAFTEEYNEDFSEFGKITSFSSKGYNADVRMIKSNEVHHLVTAVFDTEAGPDLVRKDVIGTSLTPLIRLIKTSL